MAIFYSAHSKSFYDSSLFDTMPPDAVEVSTDTWHALLDAQANGQQIMADASGKPVAVTPPPPPAPPPPPPPTPVELAYAALDSGMPIMSSSNPALNGTYPVDAVAQGHLQAEMLSLIVSGSFADGATTVDWPTLAGQASTFSIAEFRALALASGAYVAGLYKVVRGTTTVLPATPVMIA